MKLLYGVNNHFIGVVKFFDTKKGFGFIASNNCNMPTPQYNQDFYVNSESFTEDNAKHEDKIVVFQIEKTKNGNKRAVNVRCITKSNEDAQLALSYYGSHEIIVSKDNRKINIYSHTYIPIEMEIGMIKRFIENDKERSPEKTCEHFSFFVDHYKQNEYSKDRYIFDRHFSTNYKSCWQTLFSIFSNEERFFILKKYPSTIRYFDDTYLIIKWLELTLNENCTIDDIQYVEEISNIFPKESADIAKQRIETLVDKRIKAVFEELSSRSDISNYDLIPSNEFRQNSFLYSFTGNDKQSTINRLWGYLALTSKPYDEEKEKCLISVRDNRFRKELSTFIATQDDICKRKDFFTYLNNLSQEDLDLFRNELETSISLVFNKNIDDKKYLLVTDGINQLSVMGEEYPNIYKQKLLPFITETLKESLCKNLNSIYGITSNFFSIYEKYTSIYTNSEEKKIRQKLIPIMKETQSLDVLSEVSTKYNEWLTLDEALVLAKQIVSQWNYQNINDFIQKQKKLFNHSIVFADIIIAKTNEVIGHIPLNHFFDGKTLKEENNISNYRYPERENCTFLKNLKQLIPFGMHSSEWEKYINGKSVDDLLILFENNVVMSLPQEIVEMIINAISIDVVDVKKERWYSKPVLKNKTHAKVLGTTNVNLFPLIAHRLQSMDITDENIALAVLLTELMTANMPNQNSDYYTHKKWEENFTCQIQNFKKTNTINPRLSVIWWAIHSKTATSSNSLKEVFCFLPPYLQIRVIKKLFKSISEGKIHHTAKSLYKLVANGERKICFPLEIAFTYLKLREEDQSNKLDDNIMLQLLSGRDDSDEWIGIRDLVTQCYGRWIAEELSDDRSNWKRNNYFNGIISKVNDNKLRVFIPQKMIDEHEDIKKYNNKYYFNVIHQIQITYNKNEYYIENEPNGISYYFDESYEAELFSIARHFNFKYNGLDNFIDFTTKEDDQEEFCECRLSDKVDYYHGIAFYWCGNKPCFRPPVRYRTDEEWEYYTILDFMRILGISTDYTNKNGKITKYGHYIILSSYLKSFAKFYEHLKCHECGNLMKPADITNFASKAVTQFYCINDDCNKKGSAVYLNHCFNKQKCNATIDSRDSKQCPNGQYICPECGACCSTENFRLRIEHLNMTGGCISDRLRFFVENNLGHWEKREYFCHKCGNSMQKQNNGDYICKNCDIKYFHS